MMLRVFAIAAALALSGCVSDEEPSAGQWLSIEVTATPVDFGAGSVGRLRYRGGLDLRSEYEDFGGLSGAEVLDDDRLMAISDTGRWFEARLVLNEAGDLVGVSNWRTAHMRDEDADLFANKAAGDSEGLTQLPDGRFAVSFEQSQTIRIYDFNRDGPFGASAAGPALAETRTLPDNVGLEALASTENGVLVVGAEGGPEPTTPIWLAPLDARAPVPPSARYPLVDGYSLTSLDRAPDGSFVALERFYAPVIGPRARITHFAFTENGVLGDVETLASLTPPQPLDNFEAIAAVRMSDGGVRLYILSDNNFNARQRTLLLAFDVIEAPAN